MKNRNIKNALRLALILPTLLAAAMLQSCGPLNDAGTHSKIVVSVKDQKMMLLKNGTPSKIYTISTSKFGIGDTPRSHRTPLGKMTVVKKIGDGQPAGAVFKGRVPTGEIVRDNAPSRDGIVSRILQLSGNEPGNRNVYRRAIYIHGTPESKKLGTPASYGCIRMQMHDVINLYDKVGVHTEVVVTRNSLNQEIRSTPANTGPAHLAYNPRAQLTHPGRPF